MPNLCELIPDFLLPVREIALFCDIVSAELTALQTQRHKASVRQFLYSPEIDREGLLRQARSLSVAADGMTDEDLLFVLRALLLDQRPYHRKNIECMLSRLAGESGFRLTVDQAQQTVTVKLALSQKEQKNSVYALLDRVLPASLLLLVSECNTYGALSEKTHAFLNAYTHEGIRTEDII